MKGLKKESFIHADASGHLKSVVKDHLPKADISSEYRLRVALQRRSLALDQMGLASYVEFEKYHNYVFDLMTQVVPASHHQVSVSQLLDADKHIWARISEYCRDGVKPDSSGELPMEKALKRAMVDPITLSILSPLPKPAGHGKGFVDASYERPTPYTRPKGEGKKGGKGGKGGKGSYKGGKSKSGKKGAGLLPLALQGGSTRNNKGEPICFNFNLGGCSYARDGATCNKGLHCCAKCFATDHSFQNCPKKA